MAPYESSRHVFTHVRNIYHFVEIYETAPHHTGVVCENMHAFGANLRKLPRQAKICTPPGGAMLAKIYGIFLVLLACAAYGFKGGDVLQA